MTIRSLRLSALALALAAASLTACSGDAPTAPAAPNIAPSFDTGYLGSGSGSDGGIVGGGGGMTTQGGPVVGGGGGREEQCPEGTTFDPITETCRNPVVGGGGG